MEFLARITIYISLAMGICIFTMFTLMAVPNIVNTYQDIWEEYQRSSEPELNEKWISGIQNYPEKIPFAETCTVPMKKYLLEYSEISQYSDGTFMFPLTDLPLEIDSKVFQRCINETIFTLSRMNMVIHD